MKREIIPGVFEVGARDYDRKTFDEIVPLPNGTSYNSYIVQGMNKTALIDSIDPDFVDQLLDNIKDFKIDYIIANHAEQDHSGSIVKVIEKFPNAQIVTNQKCSELLQLLLHLPQDKFKIIEDGETLDLGYKNLKFIFTPWVHWPETMCTYLVEEKILFSCDFFGSHIASEELFVQDEKFVLDMAKIYYAEIMMPFRAVIEQNIKKLAQYEINIICPSHGQMYNNPKFIIDTYKKWIDNQCENKVVILYVSMHESTKIIAEYLHEKLGDKSLLVNVSDADVAKLAGELIDAKGIVFATPAFLTGMHPNLANVVFLINALKPKTKFIGITGSFGWGQIIEKQIKEMLPRLQVDYLESVLIKGKPKNFGMLDRMIKQIEEKL